MADPGNLGPVCTECGWTRGKHRPAAPTMGQTACPRAEETATDAE